MTIAWHDRTKATGPRTVRWELARHYRVEIGGQPFTDRWRFLTCPAFSVMITRIFGPDGNRDPHDHSRAFVSVAIRGGYTERIWDTRAMTLDAALLPVVRVHRRWRPYILRRHQAHDVTEVTGALRTIVLAGPHHGTFRFWTPEGPVDYKDYG